MSRDYPLSLIKWYLHTGHPHQSYLLRYSNFHQSHSILTQRKCRLMSWLTHNNRWFSWIIHCREYIEALSKHTTGYLRVPQSKSLSHRQILHQRKFEIHRTHSKGRKLLRFGHSNHIRFELRNNHICSKGNLLQQWNDRFCYQS